MSSTIETFGSTRLVQIGSLYFLYSNGGTGPSLKYQGADYAAGQFGQWAPIGVEQTASGYEVAWKVTGADQYAVWTTDNNGNYVSNILDTVSGTSAALQSIEASFQQDLNGDGSIGSPPPPPPTVVEANGVTSLTEVGTHFYLYGSGGTGPSLKYQGADYVAGQFGQVAPIGAEQTASGYEVAWKVPGADQYSVWVTDNNGNYLSNTLTSVSGTSAALQAIETSFHQDLNGDGSIGSPAQSAQTVIEANGATSLTEVGTHFYLYGSGGTGPSLKYQGADFVAGQFGQWAPIGAEQTTSGYEVALKVTDADQYAVWNTDSNGNFVSIALNTVSGTSAALESIETSFQQDLNGDRVIGPPIGPPPPSPPTVIEAFGSTTLTEVGTNFYLCNSSGVGPSLKYQGVDFVAGQFGQWAPIGAEQTTSGYEVALKVTGADQYAVWNTDSNGNFVSIALNTVSGTSAALESIETSFQQDLNGDRVIGPPPPSGAESSPHFVFEGVDSSGAQIYDVTWDTAGLQPFAVRVLTPDHPSTTFQHNFLYALPVEAGLAQSTWGSGLDELHKLDVQDQYNATIIEPIFPKDPWYADNATDPTMNFETFMATFLPAWVDSHFSTSGTEDDLLIGFSKSGYGALDLLLKHPAVFDAVAAWDFPADMAYNDFGAGGNYGTEANFQNNYRLTGSFIDTWKAPFTTQDRIWISGYSAFQSQVSDFDTLLTSHGVLHTLSPQTFDTHSWSGGWLPDAVAGLYGLVENGFQGGLGPPPPSPTVIEGFGSTSLTEVGDSFYLYNSSGVGPSLKYQGASYFAGQFGQWAPIGAEQTTSGFEVAWKVAGADQYAVWSTDSNGNYTSNIVNSVVGTDPTLESLETSFHQDLNGDRQVGLVGVSPTVLDGHTGGQTLTASGPSTLIGGPNDILNGGPGADTFVFLQNFGANTVNNFTPLVDTLEFSHSVFADAATVFGDARQVGTDVVITQDAQDVATLHNVQLANLHATDFHLI